LKANKLEESIKECGFALSPNTSETVTVDIPNIKFNNDSLEKKYYDLCKKQLLSKIQKLPLNKINSKELAEIYFSPYYGHSSLQNDGKKAILELTRDYDFIVKHSGQCFMREGTYINGYGKYIGEETYTTIFGEKRTLPAFQLLWCEN